MSFAHTDSEDAHPSQKHGVPDYAISPPQVDTSKDFDDENNYEVLMEKVDSDYEPPQEQVSYITRNECDVCN